MGSAEGRVSEYHTGDAVEVDRSRLRPRSSAEPADPDRLPEWVPAVIAHVEAFPDGSERYGVTIPGDSNAFVSAAVLRRRQ